MTTRRMFAELLRYLRNPPTVVEPQLCDSIQKEIEFHVDERTRDYVEQGMSVAEARQEALNRFGDVKRVAAECRRESIVGQSIFHRLHLVATVALLVAVVMLALHHSGPVGVERAEIRTGDIVGRVVDENAGAIAGAHILAVVKTWPANGYRQQAYMTMSSGDGQFSIEDVYPVGKAYQVQIAAVADDHVMRSDYISSSGDKLQPVEFRLGAARRLAMRVQRPDGAAMTGVEVFPFRRVDDAGGDHLVYFDSADPIIRTSDDGGMVSLPYFVPGDQVTVYVRPPGGEWDTHEVAVPAEQQMIVLKLEEHTKETVKKG